MPPKKRPPDRSNAKAHDESMAKRVTRSKPNDSETLRFSEPNLFPSTSSSHIGPSYIVLQLSQNTLENTKLQNPRILTIPDVVYITEPNGTTSDGTTHYLYDLICRIFECELLDVKLYRQPDGAFRNEKEHGWQPVDYHEKVETGIYLCNVGKGISLYSLN